MYMYNSRLKLAHRMYTAESVHCMYLTCQDSQSYFGLRYFKYCQVRILFIVVIIKPTIETFFIFYLVTW